MEDDQAFVSHNSSPYIAVAVMSYAKKLRPDTVTESPTDVGMFRTVVTDVSGGSNENTKSPVPTTLPTVSMVLATAASEAVDLHLEDVPDVHVAVAQAKPPVATELVKSTTPKLSPDTVSEAPPVDGRL